uniref:G-protein coupled receptors family 1 profile domain-containing protein n=1 Tax=Glossina brevipalpis TaxID=37001 RepID=A0A1A9W9Z2_9MUSC
MCPKIRGHATTAFVLSLCISDLLFCSLSLPLTAVRFFQEKWTFGDTLCKIFPVVFYGNVAVSLLSMVGITLNRQKKTMRNHRQFDVLTKEQIFYDRKCREDNRLTLMMVTIFVCFLVCFLPLMLANVVDDERNTSYPWLHIIASVMAWASSVINPIIYAASNRNYRSAYRKLLANLRFWTDTRSSVRSKTFHHSKNSKDISGTSKNTPIIQGVKMNNIKQDYQN